MENITSFYYRYLRYIQAKDDSTATPNDKYMALSYAVRGQIVDKWIATQKKYHEDNPRRLYYLSMEYVFGKSLKQHIVNMGLEKSTAEAAENLGFLLEELYEQEDDFELGNAGIGRLAASLLDSLASLGLPAMAYGLHYDYAVFRQDLNNGIQTEQPNDWLHKEHPWEIKRPEYSCHVGFNGEIERPKKGVKAKGPNWVSSDDVIAVPNDFPIPGYMNDTVNTLRLWSAQSSEEFLPDYLNHGDYIRACEEKFQSGRITNYLFPDEDVHRTTEMRIKQQYFFVSASLQDIIRRYKQHNADILNFDKKVVIQLNGSKCAIAIAELMRLLIDFEKVSWEDAWRITRNVFAYTSHAVSFDNLEKWPVYLIEEVLPRHMQIIDEIDKWHLKTIGLKGKNEETREHKLSIIEEGEVKWVGMAHLAMLGSFCINGVSRVQTEILKKRIYKAFSEFIPGKIKNITNGIALRRWILCANKPLAGLINELIGESWITHYTDIEKLEEFKDDNEVIARLGDIKHAAKRHLSLFINKFYGIKIDPDTFFDIHCKKIHSYKRQVLQIFYILLKYLRIKNGEEIGIQRTHIFGGKAAPSDFLAKQIIHLINIVVEIINNDPLTKNKLQVVFLPNYGLSLAEKVVPAADLSEQLSAPNYEASGTSNMKFAINGALTIASHSGANIEMAEKLGPESIVVFGHKNGKHKDGQNYKPSEILDSQKGLKDIFALLDKVLSSFPDGNLVNPLLASLKDTDPFFVLLDFKDYEKKQNEIDTIYKDRSAWLSRSLTNIARAGWFSSDRVVGEYSRNIWKVVK